MAWRTIAQAPSVEELQRITPAVADIPTGSPVLITIKLAPWFPVAHIANLPTMEFWAQRFYGEMRVDDVRAADAWTVEIHGTAIGFAWILLVAILVGGLVAVGVAWAIRDILVQADITEQQVAITQAEMAMIVATEKLVAAGYPLAEITKWLEGLKPPPVEAVSIAPELSDILKTAGIGIGTVAVIVIALLIFMGMRR